MTINIDPFFAEYYEQGHLDYAINEMARWNSVDEWVEYLKHEPIAFFQNTTEWTLVYNGEENIVTWTDPEGSGEKEEHEVGMMIKMPNGDLLLHCPNGSASMFYQPGEDGTLRAIYID